MDKETLSSYGWIVVLVLVLSVLLALATPFGDFISTAVKNTTQGLFDVQQKAMGIAGLVVDDQKFEDSGSNNTPEPPANDFIPGLYQTGALDKYNKEGGEAIADMLITPWDELIADGTIKVKDGAVYTVEVTDLENGTEIEPIMNGIYGGTPYVNPVSDKLAGDLFIPDNGTITAIGDLDISYDDLSIQGDTIGLAGCNKLTGIKFPSTTKLFAVLALSQCTSLTNINIPEGTTRISQFAFSGAGISDLYIPKSITSIGICPLFMCPNMQRVHIEDIGAWCAVKCDLADVAGIFITNIGYGVCELYVDGQKVVDLVIPDGTTLINDAVFAFCKDLKTVTIPNSVKEFGQAPFYGAGASLENPENSQISIYYEGDLYNWMSIKCNEGALHDSWLLYCDNKLMEEVVIPDTIETISSYTFQRCDSIKSVTIPSHVKVIQKEAFYGCNNLTQAYFENLIWVCNAQYHKGAKPDQNKLSTPETAATYLTSYSTPGCGFEWLSTDCSITGHYSGDGRDPHMIATINCYSGHQYTCQCSNGWIIPNGGTYTPYSSVAGKSVYNAGDVMPCGYTPRNKDTYTYGDYLYTYSSSNGGWEVKINTAVTDKNQTSYGEILESINTAPIVSISATFMNCANLQVAPKIPNTVTNVGSAFANCTSLKVAPAMPTNVTTMQSTFNGCTALTTAPNLSNCTKLTDLKYAFYGCTNLKTYTGNTNGTGDFSSYVIPATVTEMSGTFRDCKLMVKAPAIPNKVTKIDDLFYGCTNLTTAPNLSNCSALLDMEYAFYNCASLKTYYGNTNGNGDFSNYIIPSKVTNMYCAFSGCASLIKAPNLSQATSLTDMGAAFADCINLTTAPVIPSSVTKLTSTFDGCSSLKTYVGSTAPDGNFSGYVIPGVQMLWQTFKDCESMVIAPTLSEGTQGLMFTFSGCTSLTGTPIIPKSVISVQQTFYNCTSLEVAPILPSDLIYMNDTFMGCTNLKTYVGSTDANGDFSNYFIPSTVTTMEYAFYNCFALKNAPTIPSSVTTLRYAFYNCTSLTGAITINATSATYDDCLYGTQITEILGSCPDDLKALILATK